MAAKSPYFVGIGAQRSGTTWIAEYLRTHPQAALPPMKECHYWTSKYSRHLRWSQQRPAGLKIRLPLFWRGLRSEPNRAAAKIGAFLGMLAHQDAAYRRFLDLWRGNAKAVGEITPAYALLPHAGFRALDGCLQQPQYFMALRNPVDRLASQIAHVAKRDRSVLSADPLDLLNRPGFAMRSDYGMTLRVLERAMEPKRLHVLFYEDLFDAAKHQTECARLCAHLGIDAMLGQPYALVNARRVQLTRQVDRPAVVQRLAPVYRSMAARYGERLPKSWRDDLALL